MNPLDPWRTRLQILDHVALLLSSYRRWTGRDLIVMDGSPEKRAERLFDQPFVVLSHGAEDDPILNYGNRAALTLWEMAWEEFTKTSSRLTAEEMSRNERARLLAEVARKGFMDDYRGVRISKSGRKFLIERATVWNLVDENNRYRGQAACFSHWTYL